MNYQRMLMLSSVFFLSHLIGTALCEDVTDHPEIANVKNRYMQSSSDGYNKIHRDKQEQLTNRMHRENEETFGYGVMVHQTHQSPLSIAHKPPSYSNLRFGSKHTPILVPSSHDTVLRPFGDRRDDLSYLGGSSRNEKILISNPGLIFDEDSILDSQHQSSGSVVATECDLKCGPNEFFCSKSCSCIHTDLHCDGQIDCGPDGEDEDECEITEEMKKKMKSDCEENTLSQHVMCPNTFICIKQEWLCDGDDDCNDYSDETHCGAKTNCSDDQFECNNGLCVPSLWMCDGENDCRDGSDEVNCTRTCSNDEFQCMDESCISLSFKCDQEHDCENGEDEKDCDFPLPNCPEGEFKCKGLLGGMGGPGGRCILQRFRCDGDNDCGDWSDEENCPKKSILCTSNEFKCDDGRCIPLRWKCDQEQDCDSGEDEKDCSDIGNVNRECSDDEYTCKDSRCILKNWVCDGTPDCKRGEDEADCDIKCDVGQFKCPSKMISQHERRPSFCVNQKHVCDGHKDCVSGEDEENCPIWHACPQNTKCQQLCGTSSIGKDICGCKTGYVLTADNYSCTDINECEFIYNPCSQTCNNTIGGFICGCITGYVLRPDLRTCKALGGAVKLIMANRGDIRQVTLSNNQYTSIIKGLPNAIALDYHYEKDLLFWTDVSADVIKQSFINGTGSKDIIRWGLESPGGLSIDWIHELIFWTDSGTRRVEVSTYDGKLRSVLVANDLDKPRAIVVHPGKYFVFWTDWGGPSPKIERSYMDGSERFIIVNDGVYWPNGLALDFATDRIFWCDAKHHVIENSKLDGSERKKILSNNLPHPFAMTIFEDNIFWTDWHSKTISSANKVTGKNFRHVHEGLHFPMGIQSYHKARQPKFENRCAEDRRKLKGGCSHLCLPNRVSRRCACPIGLTLLDDQKTCTSVPDKLLILARKKDIRIKQLDSKNSKEVDNNIPLDNLKSTMALDWCSKTDRIYWSDVGKSTINRAYLNGSNQETVIQDGLVSPAGLALDWLTNKLYWTDAGTHRIEVASIDGQHRALLIWQNLYKPRDIVVNPLQGYMFWTDWGSEPVIESAGMDGSKRKSIVSENLFYPNGITIDYANNRLYFVDAGTKVLEFVNFDGTGRNRLIGDGLQHPFGIDVYEKYVYWSDWETRSIWMADKNTGKERKTVISDTSDLMDVRVFHRKRKSIRDPCASNNGGCSYMCLLNPLPDSTTCVCPIGVKLGSDGKSCKEGPSSYIIFAHRTDIRQVSLDIDYMIDVVLPLPQISNVYTIDVDLLTGDLYYADNIEDVIVKSSPDGQNVQHIITESMDSVDGMVICSVSRKIYFADAGRKSIEVSELNGSHRKVLVWQDLESPRAIAIDYNKGYLFFSDWGEFPRIERADMDGDKRSRIITSDLFWPNGLAVDKEKYYLYWTDAKLHHIKKSDFEGNFQQIVIEFRNEEHPYGISITSSKIYWTDWKTLALHSADKNNLTGKTSIIAGNLEGLMDVKVVDTKEHLEENSCGHNNGGCSHLCLRKPHGYSCQCPTGLKMQSNGKDCEDLPKAYLLIALRSGIGRISLDTPEMFDVVLPIDSIYGAVVVDYHYEKNYLFYADVNADAIKRINMKNFNDVRTIVSTGLNTPNGIAVDWMANNLYWSDSALKIIEVSRLDGSYRKTLLKSELDDVRSMILYKNFLWFADWGHTARIERSLLDGSDRKVIVNSDLGFPTGLAIDFMAKKLFWADALHDRVEMSDFDGSKRTKIIMHAEHPFGFTLTNSYFYYSDWYNKSIIRVARHSNGIPEEVRHNLRGALEIRSVSAERQPHYFNPCNESNGGCPFLCLYLGGKKYVCECPNYSDRPCKREIRESSMKPDDNDEPTLPPYDFNAPIPTLASDVPSSLMVVTVIIVAILLIMVVAAILYLCNSKKKEKNKARLTFSNPNYNGSGHYNDEPGKSTFFKRFKYDKSQDRVYEEKALSCGQETTSSIMMSSANPSPMPSHSAILSTIG